MKSPARTIHPRDTRCRAVAFHFQSDAFELKLRENIGLEMGAHGLPSTRDVGPVVLYMPTSLCLRGRINYMMKYVSSVTPNDCVS